MEKDIPKVLGEALRQARAKVGISQEELAEAAGLHRTYISSIERGERNLGVANLIKISKALGINLSDFFANLEKMGII